MPHIWSLIFHQRNTQEYLNSYLMFQKKLKNLSFGWSLTIQMIDLQHLKLWNMRILKTFEKLMKINEVEANISKNLCLLKISRNILVETLITLQMGAIQSIQNRLTKTTKWSWREVNKTIMWHLDSQAPSFPQSKVNKRIQRRTKRIISNLNSNNLWSIIAATTLLQVKRLSQE